MNRTQHYSLLRAMEMDKKNLLKYQEIYNYAYILSDGIFKIVFAEEKDHTLLISLVNAMLDLHGGEAIKEITLEMQEFPGVFCKKDCIVDIIGTTNAGERVLVEVQQQGDDFYRNTTPPASSRTRCIRAKSMNCRAFIFSGSWTLRFSRKSRRSTSTTLMKCATVGSSSRKSRRFSWKSRSFSGLKKRGLLQMTTQKLPSGSAPSR